MNFNATNLQTIRADLNKALAEIEAKHGIKISVGNISYTPTTFTTKLSAIVVGDEEGETVVNAKWAVDFNRQAAKFGMKASDLGRTVRTSSGIAKLVGATQKSGHVIVERGGKNYKADPRFVQFVEE